MSSTRCGPTSSARSTPIEYDPDEFESSEEDADVRARTPAAMAWVNVLARTIAVVVQVAVGAAIFISVIGVHPWIPGLGMIAWIGGIILMHRWWSSHPGRVVGVPLVLAAAYFLLVVIADRFGLVGA
jgi:hypothetical protein